MKPKKVQASGTTDQKKVKALAGDVYNFGYPIVLMDATMKQATAVPNSTSVPGRPPLNQFAHFRTYHPLARPRARRARQQRDRASFFLPVKNETLRPIQGEEASVE